MQSMKKAALSFILPSHHFNYFTLKSTESLFISFPQEMPCSLLHHCSIFSYSSSAFGFNLLTPSHPPHSPMTTGAVFFKRPLLSILPNPSSGVISIVAAIRIQRTQPSYMHLMCCAVTHVKNNSIWNLKAFPKLERDVPPRSLTPLLKHLSSLRLSSYGTNSSLAWYAWICTSYSLSYPFRLQQMVEFLQQGLSIEF